jgi:hypothetical protein
MKLIRLLNRTVDRQNVRTLQSRSLAPIAHVSDLASANTHVEEHNAASPFPSAPKRTVAGFGTTSRTRPILMSFAQADGIWYCRFFEDELRTRRLPRRLTFRDPAKVWTAAKNGHADLNDDDIRLQLEADINAGRGSIWLRMSEEQIATLA